MITADNITVGYGPCDVLSSLSVTAKPGELIALIGPNGSGKSTLIKALCGLLPCRSGEIKMNGAPLSSYSRLIRAQKLAYLAQDRDAQPAMTGADIVTLGRAPYRGHLGRVSETGQAAIDRAVKKTDSTAFLDRAFSTLSGGEKARILLARALAVNAPVLLADEPIAALDPYYQLSMMEILQSEAREGRTVIAALHDLALVSQFADRVWVMDKGQIVGDGSIEGALTSDILTKVFRISKPASGFQQIKRAD